jgi:diacylglycerol kinase family enzyme
MASMSKVHNNVCPPTLPPDSLLSVLITSEDDHSTLLKLLHKTFFKHQLNHVKETVELIRAPMSEAFHQPSLA